MNTLRPLMFALAAGLPLLSIPAFAQSNAAPGNPAVTGTPGGTTTTQDGKTVNTPPQPPSGKGGESGGSGR